MKKKLPWMAWDIPAYLADTTSFNAEQHGAYLMLLAAMWMDKGSLPNDDEDLATAARCTPEQWARMRTKILAKFDIEDGMLTQKRLEKEWARANEVSAARQIAGKKGGEARAKNLAKGVANAKQTPKQNPTPPQPHSTNVEGDISGDAPAKQHKAEYPAAFDQCWFDYPRRSGGNSKADAFKGWHARIKEGTDPEVIWQGVKRYAIWCERTGKVGTEFVMQGARFFGPSHQYHEEWKAPLVVVANRQDARAATMAGLGTKPQPAGEQHGTDREEPIDVQARVIPDPR